MYTMLPAEVASSSSAARRRCIEPLSYLFWALGLQQITQFVRSL